MPKNEVFRHFLKNAWTFLAEISYVESSWQDNSNDVWLSYPENHFDPFLGHIPHIPDIPGPNFGSKFFFCFFSRIESFWCQKSKKNFFLIFAHWGSPQRGGYNFFLGQKVQKFIFYFFHKLSHSGVKNRFFFIFAYWGSPQRGWWNFFLSEIQASLI